MFCGKLTLMPKEPRWGKEGSGMSLRIQRCHTTVPSCDLKLDSYEKHPGPSAAVSRENI